MRSVGLVSMPFGPLFSPSIALSLLKAGLTRNGIDSQIHYFTMRFAELVGSRFYLNVAGGIRPSMTKLAGEWIFSAALSDMTADEEEAYVETVLRRRPPATSVTLRRPTRAQVAEILRARDKAREFVELCAEEVLRDEPSIVGFTSVFQQQTASLALAKRIKALRPETFIVFGGANVEGVMGAEAVRQFDFIDAAVSGEGDLLISELVRRVLDGRSVEGLPGVRTQASVAADFAAITNAPTVMRMDELPYPDYDDYFEQFGRSRFARSWQPRIFFETSRGCWWGEKMHCTFCGLNGATMQFRSKSADRALDELTHLTGRHPGCEVEMTDNILDLAYFKDFIPELARRGIDYGLFYETKANLRKEQLRMMRDAGIRAIQPGIESLHDSVLKLMRKGVSALQNIQLLKWCKEFGVEPRWNILVGFPGESADSYAWMASIIPLLSHLPPANFIAPIRLDRFSPNYFEAEKLGIAKVEPLSAYQYVYRGVPREALRNIAYHFEFDYERPQDVAAYATPVAHALNEWHQQTANSDLFSIDTGDHLLVWDLRPVARRALTVLSGAERLLYIACDAVTDVRQIEKALASLGAPRTTDEIAAMLAPLITDGFVLQDGGRYLALAVPVGEYAPAQPVVKQFYGVVKSLGVPTNDGIAVPLNGARKARTARSFPRIRQHSISTPQFKVEGSYLFIR